MCHLHHFSGYQRSPRFMTISITLLCAVCNVDCLVPESRFNGKDFAWNPELLRCCNLHAQP